MGGSVLSGKEGWKSTSISNSISNSNSNSNSKRWMGNSSSSSYNYSGESDESDRRRGRQMEGLNGMYSETVGKKRVMLVVDQSSRSKHAMMWALTHVANKGDMLTLLHITSHSSSTPNPHHLASLCKASNPQVEVEALVIQSPPKHKLSTVLTQVKKLEVSVLVLAQSKPSPVISFSCLLGNGMDDIVEQCINNAECLTIGVRKQSKGMGGYLISTRCQKNFWLLA